MSIKSKIKKIWKKQGQEEFVTPCNETIIFELKYKSQLIGILKLEKSIWSFAYSESFKKQTLLRVCLKI